MSAEPRLTVALTVDHDAISDSVRRGDPPVKFSHGEFGPRVGVPRILSLATPRKLTPGAQSIKLRIAATETCSLTVSGKHFQLSPKPRTIRVRLRHGTSALILRLSAGGLHSTTKVLVSRG